MENDFKLPLPENMKLLSTAALEYLAFYSGSILDEREILKASVDGRVTMPSQVIKPKNVNLQYYQQISRNYQIELFTRGENSWHFRQRNENKASWILYRNAFALYIEKNYLNVENPPAFVDFQIDDNFQ